MAYKPNLYQANVTAKGNSAAAAEEDLISVTVPADALGTIGRCVNIKVWGSTSGDTGAKTIRLYFGSTVVILNDVTTSPVSKTWMLEATIFMTAAGTQKAYGWGVVGSVPQTVTLTTPTEDETGSIVVKVTGEVPGEDANAITAEGFVLQVP